MTISTMKDRRKRDNNDSPLANNKKTKLQSHDTLIVNSEHVEASELASAFALASLASFSPRQSGFEMFRESRDVENGSDHIPMSPETRSPIRRFRRVTFSTDTKEPKSDLRSVSFSPRTNTIHNHQQYSGLSTLQVPTPLESADSTFWKQNISTSFSAFHPHVAHPPSAYGQWICDFCNTAAFNTYEEACAHEESCHMKHDHASRQDPSSQSWRQFRGSLQRCNRADDILHSSRIFSAYTPPDTSSSSSDHFYLGSLSLGIPDSDKDWLSKTNCFIRASCVEAFATTEAEVMTNSKHREVTIGQVGIRCCFCRDRECAEKEVGAVAYPSSVSGIYETVKRWQKVHLLVCKNISNSVKARIEHLSTGSPLVPTARQYWVDSARSLGMVDTHEGIRFSIDPKRIMPLLNQRVLSSCIETNVKEDEKKVDEEQEINNEERTEKSIGETEGESIVHPEDMDMVPPYVYFLMRQVERTHFTEADRFVARSKGPIGFPGFQCRHCRGHAGLGKYFPVTTKSLSTNSTSQNIHSHLLKCRKVSPYVKDQLLALKDEKSKLPRLEPGWRRIFFEKIWSRLHK
jgi:hypothetical protein